MIVERRGRRGKVAVVAKKQGGKVRLAVPVTGEEKREMAAIAKREGLSLAAWAERAIRRAREKRIA